MLLARNNFRGRLAVVVALTMFSFGGVTELPAQVANFSKPSGANKPMKIEGVATWYKVPAKSVAKRRAGKDELTAAHNRLPFGIRVRVTHLGNGRDVVVRITDRGVYKRGVVIDLCKEAAEKLDMLREGSARVRLEVLPDDKVPTSTSVAPW
jgi:rare lipoprotein A